MKYTAEARKQLISQCSRLITVFLPLAVLSILIGCQQPTELRSFPVKVALQGIVTAGGRPLGSSHVQLYTAGTAGAGSAATPLLTANGVSTDTDGQFIVNNVLRCTSADDQVYVLTTGGYLVSQADGGTNNPAIAFVALLGQCDRLTSSKPIAVNEFTTVGFVWPLRSYLSSPSSVGSAPGDKSFQSALSAAHLLTAVLDKENSGSEVLNSDIAQSTELMDLVDLLRSCTTSSGSSARAGGPCSELFSAASVDGATPPTDTLTAAARIARKLNGIPTQSLSAENAAESVYVETKPTRGPVTLDRNISAPVIYPPTGTYVGAQTVTISTSRAVGEVRYTTDGSTPTASSPVYIGPFALSNSATIQAISSNRTGKGASAYSAITIVPPASPSAAKLQFVTQPSDTQTNTPFTPSIQVAVEDANGDIVRSATNLVSISLAGGTLAGTLSATPQNGIATFSNLMVKSTGTGYSLSATSSTLASATSSNFAVTAGTLAHATTYYVDNCVTVGSDSNNGTSTSTPWLTIAKVNGSTFSPGDSILFEKTCTWRERLTIPSGGSAGNPITFGSYGSGALPIINGADLLTGWTNSSGALYDATEPSTANLNGGSFQVFEDGTKFVQNTVSSASLTAGQWFLDTTGNKIWVHTLTGDNPGGHMMEISVREGVVNGSAADYFALQNLTIKNGSCWGVDITNYWRALHSVSISGVTSQDNYGEGIAVYDTGSGHYPISNVVLSGNTTSGNGLVGIDVFANVAAISPVSIVSNTSHDDSWNPSGSALGAIHLFGPNISNVTIEKNSVYNAGINLPTFKAYPNTYWTGSGIYIDTIGTGTVIRYNKLYNNNANGITIEEVTGSQIYDNVTYINGVAGITLDRIAHNTLVYNNTSYGNPIAYQLWAPGNSTPGDMTNNDFINNIGTGSTVEALDAEEGGENDGTYGSGNVYTYNSFGPQTANFIQWGAAYKSTYAAWETAYGGTTHSVQTDPLLTNPGSAIFTLQSTSPAIGAGTTPLADIDIVGKYVPPPPRTDIGAYQF